MRRNWRLIVVSAITAMGWLLGQALIVKADAPEIVIGEWAALSCWAQPVRSSR